MFTFAHLSDIHLAPLPRPPAGALFGKRLIGYLSWQTNRRHRHLRAVLDALRNDLRRQQPDHFCVTGDLVNIALPAEITAAAQWLAQLAPAEKISLVPGNHDAYVAAGASLFRKSWRPWMGDEFPFVHRRGPAAFVGVSTAIAMPPFVAAGRIGRAQLVRLEEILDALRGENLFRVVMLHHPPQPDATTRLKGLYDAANFRAVIARAGAELILHGHLHKAVTASIDGPTGPVPVYGAGSASLNGAGHAEAAQYYLFGLAEGRLVARSRRYQPGSGDMRDAPTENRLNPRS